MSEADEINNLLHSKPIKQNYTAESGETVRIELPRIPMTRQTQFVGLKTEISGDVGSFIETSVGSLEGLAAPTEISGKAINSGTVNFTLKAIDRISGEEIPDVKPVEITVNIKK